MEVSLLNESYPELNREATHPWDESLQSPSTEASPHSSREGSMISGSPETKHEFKSKPSQTTRVGGAVLLLWNKTGNVGNKEGAREGRRETT
jgi:hypothetical protein